MPSVAGGGGPGTYLPRRGGSTMDNEIEVGLNGLLRSTGALEMTPSLMMALFSGSPNAVAVTDVNGIVRVVNDRTLALFGHKNASDVIGRDIFLWLPKEKHERVRDGLRLLHEHGTLRNSQYTLQRQDGSRFSGAIHSTIVRPSGGDSHQTHPEILGIPYVFGFGSGQPAAYCLSAVDFD